MAELNAPQQPKLSHTLIGIAMIAFLIFGCGEAARRGADPSFIRGGLLGGYQAFFVLASGLTAMGAFTLAFGLACVTVFGRCFKGPRLGLLLGLSVVAGMVIAVWVGGPLVMQGVRP